MPAPRKPNRKALNVRLDPEVIARLKRVQADAAGVPCFATISGIVEAGIIAECDRIEAALHEAYPGMAMATPAGRRILPGHRRLGVVNTHCSDNP